MSGLSLNQVGPRLASTYIRTGCILSPPSEPEQLKGDVRLYQTSDKVFVFGSLEGTPGCWVHLPSAFYTSGVPAIRHFDEPSCSSYVELILTFEISDKLEKCGIS